MKSKYQHFSEQELNEIAEQMIFTVPDVAFALCCSTRKVFELVRNGKIKKLPDPHKRGIRVTVKAVQDYIKSIELTFVNRKLVTDKNK